MILAFSQGLRLSIPHRIRSHLFSQLQGKNNNMMSIKTPNDLYDYWFGDSINGSLETIKLRSRSWFTTNPEFEQILKDNAELYDQLGTNINTWNAEEDPRGAVATVVVLDQFGRSINRGTAQAFQYDTTASDLVASIVNKGWFENYSPIERFCLVLCLHHSEQIEKQRFGESLNIGMNAPEDVANYFSQVKQEFLKGHQEVVEKFGRFPHRNELLVNYFLLIIKFILWLIIYYNRIERARRKKLRGYNHLIVLVGQNHN
jgi:uncharacterized protein (DUF924 family)